MLCVGPAFLAASTAAEIERLLATDVVTYAQASRFVLDAANAAAFADPDDAFRFARERNWLPRNAAPDSPARLDGVSLLIMRSFDVRGGFLYRWTNSPHYAYREMEFLGIVHGRVAPAQLVSGEHLLYLVGRILDHVGDSIASEPEFVFEQEDLLVLAEQIHIQLEEYEDVQVTVVDEGIMISLSDIQFLADSIEIPYDEREKLYGIAVILRSIPGRRIAVAGHTALAGTEEGRLRLSTERAQAVAAFLVDLGVREAWEISATGFGAEQPVADNDTPEGMAANRRVEITILEN